MLIAIQGEIGSFHHMAACAWYGKDTEILPCKTFQDVFEAIKTGKADTAIVAIENSLFGSINEVYDLLLSYRIPIVGEIPLRVQQCLIGRHSATVQTITHVYSHPVALAQCSDYLASQLPNAERSERYDTAESVAYVMNLDDHSAAIASPLAAKLYKAKIIQADIQNHDMNFTRFLVLDAHANIKNPNKSSLILQTTHEAGALYRALGIFAKANANLTKLQSRPIKGKVWKYMFYIDVACSQHTLEACTIELQNQGCDVINLGSYKKATSEL